MAFLAFHLASLADYHLALDHTGHFGLAPFVLPVLSARAAAFAWVGS